MLPEDEEESPGAFTVANKNDTDADNVPDSSDSDVTGDDIDLMEMRVNRFIPYNEKDDGEKMITLTVPANAKLYKSKDKKSGEESTRSWKAKDLDNPKTFWVELQNASSSVRSEVFTLTGGGATDTVKATGVWATFEHAYNTGNIPPNDLDDAHLRDDVAGGLGPMLQNGPNSWSGKWGVTAGILLEFKIEPAGLENEGKVKIDLTRQKESTAGTIIAGNQNTFETKTFPAWPDLPNDDNPDVLDEDVIPKNKHIYSVDNPRVLLVAIPPDGNFAFYRGNYYEYVRVAVGTNVSRPNAYIDESGVTHNATNAGSRASTKEFWLTRLFVVTINGNFTFLTGVDPDGNQIRNIIQTGDYEPLTKP